MATIQNVRTTENPSRAYEWEVEVLGTSSTGQLPILVERALNVSIPETSVDQIEVPFKSRSTYYAGRDAAGHTVDITFWDSEGHEVYRFFKNWIESISNSSTGGGVTRDLYGAELLIKQMAHDSETITMTHQLTKVFPTSVGEISLDYSSSEHSQFTVTFSYDANLMQE